MFDLMGGNPGRDISDASEQSYLWTENQQGDVRVSFLAAVSCWPCEFEGGYLKNSVDQLSKEWTPLWVNFNLGVFFFKEEEKA